MICKVCLLEINCSHCSPPKETILHKQHCVHQNVPRGCRASMVRRVHKYECEETNGPGVAVLTQHAQSDAPHRQAAACNPKQALHYPGEHNYVATRWTENATIHVAAKLAGGRSNTHADVVVSKPISEWVSPAPTTLARQSVSPAAFR